MVYRISRAIETGLRARTGPDLSITLYCVLGIALFDYLVLRSRVAQRIKITSDVTFDLYSIIFRICRSTCKEVISFQKPTYFFKKEG